MSFRVRPATGDDFRAIYQMAKLTGGGFTNLPADRGTLVAKLARSEQSFARSDDKPGGDLYVFILEDPKTGKVRGIVRVTRTESQTKADQRQALVLDQHHTQTILKCGLERLGNI